MVAWVLVIRLDASAVAVGERLGSSPCGRRGSGGRSRLSREWNDVGSRAAVIEGV
jgi:hypothetical protein